MSVRAATRIVASLALLTGLAGDLFAHASLSRASPAVDSVVRVPPTEIRLWFSSRIEAAFSAVRVVDGNGVQVSTVGKEADPSDPTLLRVLLPPLARGTYHVFWRVVSIDTHVISGDYRFSLQP